MRDNYDFTNGVKNPYAKALKDKRQITINLDDKIIVYFKNLAKETDMSYQSLINMYLLDCVNQNKKIKIKWE